MNVTEGRIRMRRIASLLLVVSFLSGCASVMIWRSAGISGKVRLVDNNGKEVKGRLQGIVVNIINLSADLEEASCSVVTDETGAFVKNELDKGAYKLEIVKEGYKITTQEITLGGHERRKISVDLVRLSAHQRRTIKMKKGREEINNPGQVNIGPPSM